MAELTDYSQTPALRAGAVSAALSAKADDETEAGVMIDILRMQQRHMTSRSW